MSSAFNKYGSIKNGLISARFYCRGNDTNYAACYDIHTRPQAGDKYDLHMQAAIIDSQLVVTVDGQPIAFLPLAWEAFVTEVAQRGPGA